MNKCKHTHIYIYTYGMVVSHQNDMNSGDSSNMLIHTDK